MTCGERRARSVYLSKRRGTGGVGRLPEKVGEGSRRMSAELRRKSPSGLRAKRLSGAADSTDFAGEDKRNFPAPRCINCAESRSVRVV